MSVRNIILNYADSVKAAILTAAGTALTGIMDAMGLIPEMLGNIPAIIASCLSLVLIYTHWRKGRSEYNKTIIETEILKAKLKALRRSKDG